jgi:hypothetical protein
MPKSGEAAGVVIGRESSNRRTPRSPVERALKLRTLITRRTDLPTTTPTATATADDIDSAAAMLVLTPLQWENNTKNTVPALSYLVRIRSSTTLRGDSTQH